MKAQVNVFTERITAQSRQEAHEMMNEVTDRDRRANDLGDFHVLYVDTDDAIGNGVSDRLAAALDDDISLRVVTGDRGLDAAPDRSWSCLVVSDRVEHSTLATLLDRLDCPTVLFTETGSSSLPDDILDRAATIVEQDNGEQSVAFLAAKIETVLLSSSDSVGNALSDALSTVERQIRGASTLFVVDGDGDVLWSSRPFEAVFPADQTDASVSGDDFYDRLDAIVANVYKGGQFVTFDREAVEERAPVVQTTSGTDYAYERHPISPIEDGLTIERFEDVTDRYRREQALRESRERLQTVVENLPVVLFVADAGGTVTFADGAGFADAPWEIDGIIGLTLEEIDQQFETVDADVSAALEGEIVDVIHEIEDHAYHTTYQPVIEDEAVQEVIGVAIDVTERRQHERRTQAQYDELSMLNRTNVLIQEIVGVLGEPATREELQQMVCDRLVESDRYELAWIGERQRSTDTFVPVATAGGATEYLDGLEVRIDDSQSGRGPGSQAYWTGEVQVVDDVRSDDTFRPWRENALDTGLQSVVAIPLEHGEITHGILAVYATEPEAFSPRITESFAVLGETIGLALTAIQNKRLLQHDTTVRLEFHSDSDDAYLVWLATACDCTLETTGSVETGDGVVQYLRVDGASPGRVVREIWDSPVESEASVTRTDGDRIVEMHGSRSLSVELSTLGARLETAISRPDGVEIVVEAPEDTDVRAIQDVIERFNPGTELTSKTEHLQPSSDEPDPSVLSSLTDRQLEVLQAAYLAGYYDWPRESTAEELADSLDIASPTLHQHFRRAERNLLDELLDL